MSDLKHYQLQFSIIYDRFMLLTLRPWSRCQ